MTLLDVRNLSAIDLRTGTTLQAIDLVVPSSTMHVIAGSSQAEKSLLLQAIAGLVERQAVIHTRGIRIDHLGASDVAQLGVVCAMPEIGFFPTLTVDENFQVCSLECAQRRSVDLRMVYMLLPELRHQRNVVAARLDLLSQRLLLLGCALMTRATVMLCNDLGANLPRTDQERLVKLLRFCCDWLSKSVVLTVNRLAPACDFADEVYVLWQGRLATFTPPHDGPAPRSPLDTSGACSRRPQRSELTRRVVLPDIRHAS